MANDSPSTSRTPGVQWVDAQAGVGQVEEGEGRVHHDSDVAGHHGTGLPGASVTVRSATNGEPGTA